MPPQPVVPQGKALIEKARTLGIPIDDLLTTDGKEIALKADRDFDVQINGVLVKFHKGERIRDWPQIVDLRKGRCPVTSLESELWHRLTLAQATSATSPNSEARPMARRPSPRPLSPPPPSPKKQLTIAEMQRGIERLRERIAEIEAFDMTSMTSTHPPAITALQVAVKNTLVRIFGEDTADFRRLSEACELQWEAAYGLGDYPALSDYQNGVGEKISHSLAILGQAIRTLEEEIADWPAEVAQTTDDAAPQRDLSKVFVVHGHDSATRETVARFIEKIGFEAVILHERPNKGRTLRNSARRPPT